MKDNTMLNNKTEYRALDIFRVVASILVVAIHLVPFSDISPFLNHWLCQILARIAVPFFFIVSGFFLESKLDNKEKIKKYVIHLIKLYLVYTVIYIPVALYNNNINNISIDLIKIIKDFFILGVSYHLWYFIAIIEAVILLYLFKKIPKIKDRHLLILSAILFIIDILYNGYNLRFSNIPILGNIVSLYTNIFVTTRNGLFFGFPFVFIGYFLKKNASKIKNTGYIKWFIISFVLMNIEGFLIFKYFNTLGQHAMFYLVPTVVTLFLSILFIKIDDNKYDKLCKDSRKLSVLIYGLHVLINFILGIILNKLGLHINSLLNYIIVVILNIIIGNIIIKLSNKIKILQNLF